MPKLEASIRLLRLLAVPDAEGDEALEAPRLVEDAIALARVHPDCKAVVFQADDGHDVPPVVARPTALTHELLIALSCAAAAAAEGVSDVAPEVSGSLATVTVHYAVDGGDLVMTAGEHRVRARTLVAARRG